MSGEPTERIDPVEASAFLKCEKCGKGITRWSDIAFGYPSRPLCPDCWLKVVPKEIHEQAFKMLTPEELKKYTFKVNKDGADQVERRKLEEIEQRINELLNSIREITGDGPEAREEFTRRELEVIGGYLFQLEGIRQGQIRRQQEEIERLRREQEGEQYPRPPDRFAGLFKPTALVPVEKQAYQKTVFCLVSLRSTSRIKKREISLYLPIDDRAKMENLLVWLESDRPPAEIKQQAQGLIQSLSPDKIRETARKYQAQAIQKLGQFLSPRGLCLYRALQRELYLNSLDRRTQDIPGLGRVFFCDEDRILKVLYPGRNYRRTEHVQEYQKLLHPMTSGEIVVDSFQIVPDGKSETEIKVSSALFVRAGDIEITKISAGKREQAGTRRGTWLIIPEGALQLFDYGRTNWHAWGDPVFLAMDIGVRRPYGKLAEDWIEDQLQIGWSQRQGKQAWSLNFLLDDLGLRDHYTFPDGDKTLTPRPVFRRNEWIRKVLQEVLWVFKSKQKRGLWKTALLRDPDAHNSQYMTIPNFLAWLKTAEGKQALKKTVASNKGEGIQGALRFVLQVEIGPNHKLNQRHRITAEEREKRIAAQRRKARGKRP